ncbi:hypothetical protein GmHk_16G045412 [Glycine max]|nr:hypothetical protein GmHk_16G045412 [Glycine max]
MRRYGGGMLYAALPLHMQRGCFRIRTHDQQVTKAQLYRCTRARPPKTSYPIAQRLFAMRRYGGGILYAALPLHMQRGCFRIRTHDQQVTKAQLYRCTRARPPKTSYPIAQRLFAMRRYGGGILYAALPLHMQRGCFRIRTHDQQVTKAQLYRCTRARPHT